MAEDENVEGARKRARGIRHAPAMDTFAQEDNMASWFESTPRLKARVRRLGSVLLLGSVTLLSLSSCESDENLPVSSRQSRLDEQSYYYGLNDVRVGLSFQSGLV